MRVLEERIVCLGREVVSMVVLVGCGDRLESCGKFGGPCGLRIHGEVVADSI